MAWDLGNRPNRARFRPKCGGGEMRIETELLPPSRFIAAPVDLAMVRAAERHCELIAHFATERTRLSKPKMMWVRGLTPTDEAGLRGNKLKVRFVAEASRLADRKYAFVD